MRKKEFDYFCCRVNICKIFQFWPQGRQFSDIVVWPLGVVGKPRVQCLEDRRVTEGTLNFPVLIALSPGTFCWPVSSRPSTLDLCPFLLLNSYSAEPGPFLTCYLGHVMGMQWTCDGGMWWAFDEYVMGTWRTCDGHVMGACDGHLVGIWWTHDGQAVFTFSKQLEHCHIFDLLLFGMREGWVFRIQKNMRGKEKPTCLQFLGPAPLCCVLVDIICQENHLVHPDTFSTPQIFGGRIRIG